MISFRGHPRFTTLFVASAAVAACVLGCSQAPQVHSDDDARVAAVAPKPPQVQILIKALIAETDEAGFQKIFHGDSMAKHFGITLVESQLSSLLKEVAHAAKLEVVSRPYLLTTVDQQTQLKIDNDDPLQVPVKKDFLVTMRLTCTPHLSRDVVMLDIDYSNGQRSAKSRVSIKNGETIVLVGHLDGVPAADGKVQVVFLTPHVAMDPQGMPVPVSPQ